MLARYALCLLLLAPAGLSQSAPGKSPATLKSVLLSQLRSTHNKEEWFVPINVAVEGLTAEQARWTDGKGNHSVGQLAVHLLYWDQHALAQFRGEKPPTVTDNNETFNSFDAKTWADTVSGLDAVMTAWEKAVEEADDAKIAKWAETIAHVGAHNAYHVGQIILVRKAQGVWDPAKGVK